MQTHAPTMNTHSRNATSYRARMLATITVTAAIAFASATNPVVASDLEWGVAMQHELQLSPDIVYLHASGQESRLDVIGPRDRAKPRPVLIYIHGGGWVGGSKDRMFLHFLPWLQMGVAVVNVEYRLARSALAPGAVEDVRCALRWVYENAEQYGLDTSRIITSGHSAGGHLSLIAGMLPASAGFDRRCPARNPTGNRADAGNPEMPVHAIVNWFGITDVADLVEGPNAKTYAVAWIGSVPRWRDMARRVSPLTWVRKDIPPILTIHGDADTIVPYSHATRLHAALDDAGLDNHALVTIRDGGHGGFALPDHKRAMEEIRRFLKKYDLLD